MSRLVSMVTFGALFQDYTAIWAAGQPARLQEPWAARNLDMRCTFDSKKGEDCASEEVIEVLDERMRASLDALTLTYRKSKVMTVDEAFTETPAGKRLRLDTSDFQTGDNSGFVGARLIKFVKRWLLAANCI